MNFSKITIEKRNIILMESGNNNNGVTVLKYMYTIAYGEKRQTQENIYN